MLVEVLLILGLIVLNGVLVMTEFAFVSARKTKLERSASNGDKKSAVALDIANRPGKFLSVVQIGVTFVSIFTGVYSGAEISGELELWLSKFTLTAHYAGTISISIVVFVISIFTIIVGELVPKQIGLIRAESIARNAAIPMKLFTYIAYPLIWILTIPGELIIKIFKIKPGEDSRVTEDEIKAIIKEGTEDGEIQEIEQDIVERVFHLGDRRAGSLMTHRTELTWLDVNDSNADNQEKIKQHLYNVYPVCDGGADKVLGIIYLKDLFTSGLNNEQFDIRKNLKDALFILESNSAYEVLEKFRESKRHFGLVVDEYGSVSGLVTLNDILLALVGEIQSADENPEYEIVKRNENSWLVDGQLPFYDFIQSFDIQHVDKNKIKYNTLGGFALSHLRRIPRTGEKFTWRGYEFEIVDMDGNRIDKIMVSRI